MKKADIRKAGGILIKNKKLLVKREVDEEIFKAPGGTVEGGELAIQALQRELQEEFGIKVERNELEKFGTFQAQAAGEEHLQVRMDVFIVENWRGDIRPSNEVEEVRWITSKVPKDMKVGSIFDHEVIPKLKKKDLIS